MGNRNKIPQKMLSVIIAISILFCAMPIITYAAEGSSTSVADPATVENWKDWFPENSSRSAGGIFTDKSVYTAKDALSQNSYFSDIADKMNFGKDKFGNDNFLVSLSAIGSTMEVKGTTAVPADTMFVLDLSNSMATDDVTEMITSTNMAIDNLLKNSESRVGVVLYSSNGSAYSNGDLGSAVVALPLNHYTSDIKKTGYSWVMGENGYEYKEVEYSCYLQYSVTNSMVSVATGYTNGVQTSGVKVTGTDDFVTGYKSKRGATYTQAALWKAYQSFSSGEDTKTKDGIQRKPILVLMTDGAPTLATTQYNNIGTSNSGNGRYTSASISFLVQLTASWIRNEVKNNYNGSEPLFYTLGLGVDNDVNAVGVLNPDSANNPAKGYWDDLYDDGVVTDISFSTAAAGTTGTPPIYGDPATMTRSYVDKYYSAEDADELSKLFVSIVDDIYLMLKKYPTLVTEGNANMDGYVSFTDEIGRFMEVKNIKGIHVGEGNLVSGSMFSEYISTGKMGDISTGQLTAMGVTLIDALETRFNINESAALQLLQNAINPAEKQIYYNSSTDFSNYIAWYATQNNEYIAMYKNSDTTPPEDAKYIVKSYMYLGSASGESGDDTELLYSLIRIREDISTGLQVLDVNMPASLLPVVTYSIEVEGDDVNSTNVLSMTNNVDSVSPACFLFEVGLDDDIDPYNISRAIKQLEEEQGVKYHKNTDGTYTFYTNRWGTEQIGDTPAYEFTVPSESNLPSDIYDHGLIGTTLTHFHPALTNHRYYFTEDTLVLYKSGNDYLPYTGDTQPSGSGFYHLYYWIEGSDSNFQIVPNYNPLLAGALADSVKTDQGWIIPKGTPKRYFGDVDGDLHVGLVSKANNVTNTLDWSSYYASSYEAEGTAEGYHVFTYLGNNGMLTVTPAQGLQIHKTVTEAVEGAPSVFNFELTLSVDGTFDYRLENADGTYTEGTITTENNKANLQIGAGQTLFIAGIPVNTEYSIVEEYSSYYSAIATNNQGTININEFSQVNFVNSPRGNGSLIVSKDIMHPFAEDAIIGEMANEPFDVTVSFEGEASALAKITAVYGLTDLTSNDGGKTFTFTLKDGEDALFSNISEGVKYTVVETIGEDQKGYSFDSVNSTGLSGTIQKGIQSHAKIINKYTFEKVNDYKVTVSGTKTVRETATLKWNNENFQIALYKIDTESGSKEQIGEIQTVSKSNPTYSFVIDETVLDLDKIGNYHFHVEEIIPNNPVQDMAYDTSIGGFIISVNDSDADGYLEISSVVSPVGNLVTDAEDEDRNTFNVVKDFENVFSSSNVEIPVNKMIVDDEGDEVDSISKSGFIFGLYDGDDLVYTAATDINGVAKFNIPVKIGEEKTFTLREIVPAIEIAIPGMTYSDSSYNLVVSWGDQDDAPIYRFTDSTTEIPTIFNKFEPTYSTPEISFSGTKTLNGGDLRDQDEFSFELYETDADFDISGHSVLEVVSVDSSDNILQFSPVYFNTIGTKYLVIKETNSGSQIKGIGYDITRYHVTVNVVKKFDGNTVNLYTESVSIHQTGNGLVNTDQIDFNNTYTINDTESVTIEGKKVLEGRNINGTRFAFSLEDEFGMIIQRAYNGVNGTFAFEPITFNAPGVYRYYVKELAPEGATIVGNDKVFEGITYDDTLYEVVVTITDNGEGGLEKSVTIDGQDYDADIITFTNTYEPKGTEITISGIKTLLGREFVGTDCFYFDLYDADVNFNILSDTPIHTATSATKTEGNTSNYNITLSYEKGDTGFHRYVLLERIPTTNKAGISYDTKEYHITIMVVDNNKGELVANFARIAAPGTDDMFQGDDLNFTNIYNPAPTQYVISGDKHYNKDISDYMFEFVLRNDLGEIERVYNNGEEFTFTELELTEAKTYTYYVEEVNGGSIINGITYDNSLYTIQIPVKDDGNGQLYVDEDNVTIQKGATTVEKILFENSYSADATDEITINAVKAIQGKQLEENEFTFELYKADDNGNKTGDAIATAKNKADGTVTFDKQLSFDEVGTYKYVVVEKNTGKERVTYDDGVNLVTIKVVDNGNGKLIVESNTVTKDGAPANSIIFNNVYTPKPEDIQVEFTVNKTVKNIGTEKIGADNFIFELSGDDQQEIVTDANGKGVFTLKYTEEDIGNIYEYTIKEVNDKRDNVTYSDAIYTVKVEVLLGNNNEIKTNIVVDEKAVEKVVVEFENIYNVPPQTPTDTPPSSENPKTGDLFRIELWIALLFVSGSGVFGATLFKKREEE